MKVVASWSGGKESCLACFRAILGGIDVSCLLNMISEDGKRSRSHGVDSALIVGQAQAMGIPIFQRKATWDDYELEFKRALHDLKRIGVTGAVFGDVFVQDHKDWVDRICKESGIKPIMPLWNRSPRDILNEFVNVGFKAIVVRVKADLLGEEWLGRRIDGSFLEELTRIGRVDLCGELGEYHTFVTDGPLFKGPVRILESSRSFRDGYWSLDISKWEIDFFWGKGKTA